MDNASDRGVTSIFKSYIAEVERDTAAMESELQRSERVAEPDMGVEDTDILDSLMQSTVYLLRTFGNPDASKFTTLKFLREIRGRLRHAQLNDSDSWKTDKTRLFTYGLIQSVVATVHLIVFNECGPWPANENDQSIFYQSISKWINDVTAYNATAPITEISHPIRYTLDLLKAARISHNITHQKLSPHFIHVRSALWSALDSNYFTLTYILCLSVVGAFESRIKAKRPTKDNNANNVVDSSNASTAGLGTFVILKKIADFRDDNEAEDCGMDGCSNDGCYTCLIRVFSVLFLDIVDKGHAMKCAEICDCDD